MLMSVELQMHDEMFHISSDSVPHSVSTCDSYRREECIPRILCVCEREGGREWAMRYACGLFTSKCTYTRTFMEIHPVF